MPAYLYGFGFECPRQSRNNAALGYDDEDSQAVLIDANDEASALAWGETISEAFIKVLFCDDQISWRSQQFASWIEPATPSSSNLQRVPVGVFPDFASWISPYKDEC